MKTYVFENADVQQEIPVDSLMSYLSQKVITLTDGVAKGISDEIMDCKSKLDLVQNALKKNREEIKVSESELSRQIALGRVLKLIKSLQREGLLVGQNKVKFIRLLNKIDSRPFSELRQLEEELIRYLPE